MLCVQVNGEDVKLEKTLSITDLLSFLGYKNHFVAVAVNGDCVAKSSFSEATIKEGDKLEILAPMVGG
jgi:sulfur carrier protein